MDKTTFICALSDAREGQLFAEEFVKNETIRVSLLFPSDLAEADLLIRETDKALVILDAGFSQGSLLEDLLLFPRVPFVFISEPGDIRNLEKVIALSGGDFVIRQDSFKHIPLIHLVARKTIKSANYSDWQRKYLKISEEQYRNLLQSIPDIVYTIDEDGVFTFLNDAVRELGYEPEDLIGKHFSELLDPEDCPLVSRNEIIQLFNGKKTGDSDSPKLFDERRSGPRKTKDLELKLKRKQREMYKGEEMIVSLTAFGEVNSSGYYLNIEQEKIFKGTVGIIRDITEKRRSERMIQKLFHAVEQTPAAVFVLDNNGIVEYINTYFLRHDNYRPEDILGKSLFDSFKTEEDIDWPAVMAQIRSGKSWQRELKIHRSNGISYWALVLLSPICSPPGNVVNTLLIAEDITQNKKLELIVKDSLKEKDKLLREIHHRVKNNLQIVASILNLQSRYVKDREDLRLFLESQMRINSMAYLHDQLYKSQSLNRIEMADYINSIRGELESLYDSFLKGINIRIEIPEDIAFDIDVANPLGLIINELLSNSLKHAFPEGKNGQVHISISREAEEKYILLIEDSGVGLPENFNPLSTETLGLTLVNTLVEQINGRIEFTNNNGALVSVTFSL